MKTPTVFALATATALAAEAPAPKAEDIAKSYKTLVRVTEKPKQISRRFLLLCRPVSPQEINKQDGPHATRFVHYYANDAAKRGEGDAAWPIGSVLVKEKLGREPGDAQAGSVEAVAGMIKRPAGTLPKSGDWEFFWSEKGKLTTIGLESCAGCHSGAKRDYVFTDFAKPAAKER